MSTPEYELFPATGVEFVFWPETGSTAPERVLAVRRHGGTYEGVLPFEFRYQGQA